jgi:long-chain acyl-CoA synthetase
LSQATKILRAASAAELYGVGPDDVTLAATPLYHSLAQRLVLLPLVTGGTAVLMEHFTPASWLDSVSRHKISFSIAVSSQLRQLLGRLDSAELGSLRCLVSSSALLDDETKAQLLSRLRCDFHECYGASEVAIATNLTAEAARHKLGSVGTAIPGASVVILGADGNLAESGVPGEILCRTPMAFSGYYLQPETTAAAMWGDYFRTGDLGRLDEDGFLTFLGRIKDIVITGGVNIYPKDVEDVVLLHPAVLECAVIALPSVELGEVVGVVLVWRDPTSAPPLRELGRLCMTHLADFQQPRQFFVLPELPRNAMGKLDKPALRRQYSTPPG